MFLFPGERVRPSTDPMTCSMMGPLGDDAGDDSDSSDLSGFCIIDSLPNIVSLILFYPPPKQGPDNSFEQHL